MIKILLRSAPIDIGNTVLSILNVLILEIPLSTWMRTAAICLVSVSSWADKYSFPLKNGGMLRVTPCGKSFSMSNSCWGNSKEPFGRVIMFIIAICCTLWSYWRGLLSINLRAINNNPCWRICFFEATGHCFDDRRLRRPDWIWPKLAVKEVQPYYPDSWILGCWNFGSICNVLFKKAKSQSNKN